MSLIALMMIFAFVFRVNNGNTADNSLPIHL